MKPEQKSQTLLGITRSKAKMFEYDIPERYHIRIPQDPAKLFTLSIGILGDLAAYSEGEAPDASHARELTDSLQFSARFFDSYMQSKLGEDLDAYLMLLGAASYYLCDLPGSSAVLAQQLGDKCDIGGQGLEDLLRWILQGDSSRLIKKPEGLFAESIDVISRSLREFFIDGTGFDDLLSECDRLRRTAYDLGSPRQLLLSDVVGSVVRKKHRNSSWHALPAYTGLSRNIWLSALQKNTFIRELWPAQHLLGRSGVLRGKSAVVQMPTSAGKTRATELIIRAAFLSGRTSLAVIVAPFRALCHEIKNSFVEAFRNEEVKIDELSDVMQGDFEIAELIGGKQVLVVTPEKFVYVLRHTPDLASSIGLLIFDEGHQFDSGTRGITYELLLTSLKSMLPSAVQKVLISAVISNASSVAEWLNGTDCEVVSGATLFPTFRTVAFTSWLDKLGRLEFVSENNPDKGEFFVPRVVEQFPLALKPKERKARVFPEKSDGQSVALLLGLKLVKNGAVAIFCGRKDTAANLCQKAVDLFERRAPLDKPSIYSDADETKRLYYLHTQNLGSEAAATRSAQLGIFSHHGNTPHGIRLAVEHAMRKGLVRFVVCTSTLAQGVNLPLRYLIVTSVYQGGERIKVRDFHNLIGRAGRAGMHTEGSILFADHVVYDGRNRFKDKWRWNQVKELLEPANSEPCISALLSFFEPLKSDNQKYSLKLNAIDFVNLDNQDPKILTDLAERVAVEHADKGFTKQGAYRQISWRIDVIAAVESFLMSHWDVSGIPLETEEAVALGRDTLAYFLAGDGVKEQIVNLFKAVAENISQKVTEPERRRVYGKTLYGIRKSQEIEEWVGSHLADLSSSTTIEETLELVWPLLNAQIQNASFKKCSNPDSLKSVAAAWIAGQPFNLILKVLRDHGAKLIWGDKFHQFKVEHTIDICEGGFGYDGSLLIGAVVEIVAYAASGAANDFIGKLQLFQKMLKYGLPAESTIALYEAGFSDRALAMELSSSLGLVYERRRDAIKRVRGEKEEATNLLQKYPSYFSHILANILS